MGENTGAVTPRYTIPLPLFPCRSYLDSGMGTRECGERDGQLLEVVEIAGAPGHVEPPGELIGGSLLHVGPGSKDSQGEIGIVDEVLAEMELPLFPRQIPARKRPLDKGHVRSAGLRGVIGPLLGYVVLRVMGYREVFLAAAVFFLAGALSSYALWRALARKNPAS